MKNSRDLRDESSSVSDVAESLNTDQVFVSVGHAAEVYNQTAFRYFLSVEQERSERSGRPLLLVLVEIAGDSGLPSRMDPHVAQHVFRALEACVRETDFTGW